MEPGQRRRLRTLSTHLQHSTDECHESVHEADTASRWASGRGSTAAAERRDGRSPPPSAVLGAPTGGELGGSYPITAVQVD
jgi:hypothetical protein